jgi:hypothetical protein
MKIPNKEKCADCEEEVDYLYQVYGKATKYKWVCVLCANKYAKIFGEEFRGKPFPKEGK